MQPKHRTMIVTRAAQGIGAGVTNAFIERGYNVAANSLNIAASTFTATERLAVVRGDIGEPSTAHDIASTAIKTFGSIDSVIRNAGIFVSKPFTEYAVQDFEKLDATNSQGYIHITQLASKQMLAQSRGGSVTGVTSARVEHPIGGINASVPMVTKRGLEAITRSLAMEYAKGGIRLNAVAPGVVKTLCVPAIPEKLVMSQERCCLSMPALTTGSGSAGMNPDTSDHEDGMLKPANISLRTPPARLWAVLLAGGDGIRLRDLTRKIVGDDRPKQFCPIVGAESLLRQTRARLDPIVSGDRQVFVLSTAHERYYNKELEDAKDSLVIAQPLNRGTAVGIIVALVRVMRADPDAVVGVFPCDHYYSDDESFRSMVRSAVAGAEEFPGSLVIVGAEAEHAETEYGWIEPGLLLAHSRPTPLYRVNRFWEKPALPQAQALFQSGCLWNTFVTIGSAATFLELLCSEVPNAVLSVTGALAGGDLAPAYARLPSVDFSRDILAPQAKRLLVVRDSNSGWADLGSPKRVLRLLAKNASQPAWFRQTNNASPQVRVMRKFV